MNVEKKLHFFIITPVINANKLFDATLKSIIDQVGVGELFDITYVIADGGSSHHNDNEYVYQALSAMNYTPSGVKIEHIRQRDKSMYDGMSKALKGYVEDEYDVFAYINAGDYYSPYAFMSIFNKIKNNASGRFWITGCVGSYNQDGQLYKLIEPVAYPPSLIKSGAFGLFLPFIQQESTFFCFKLLKEINLEKLSKFRLAGDFFIWKSLADAGCKLEILPVWLAGFREHEGQLSEKHRDEYYVEMKTVSAGFKPISLIKSSLILALYCIHPRLRPKNILARIRKWN